MSNESSESGGFTEQVSDPEDYNRTQRFKEIHQARQAVTRFLSEMEIPESGGTSYYPRESTRLANLVAIYVMELEPLIIRSDVDDAEILDDSLPYDSLLEFATGMGILTRTNSGDGVPSPPEVMRYFAAANRFYARIGMDLELEEESGDAGFDYADLLDEGPPGTGDAPEIEGVSDD